MIKFSKCKVFKLNKDMIDFANENKRKFEKDIGNIYQMCRNLYYIEKDCPELAEKVVISASKKLPIKARFVVK